MPLPGWMAARFVSTPLLKPYVLIEPGFTGLSVGALLPRVTMITCWLSGVARIWCAYLPVSSWFGWFTSLPIVPSRLMWWTVRELGSLYAVSRYSPFMSTLVWIGRD